MDSQELHPLAAEVSRHLQGHTGPFMMFVSCLTEPDQMDGLIEAFLEPLEKTVQEPGNFTYRLTQDLMLPQRFVVIEHWRDLAALDEHLKQPYLQILLEKLDSILAEPPEVRVLIEHYPGKTS